MYDLLKKIWSRFKRGSRLPEMRVIWLLLGIIFILLITDLAYFKAPGAWVRFFVFLLLGIVVFITSFRLATSNLEVKIQESRLSSIISNLKEGIVAYDEDFRILVFNAAAEKIFKVRKGKIIGQYLNPGKAENPELRLMVQTLFPSLAPIAVRRSEPGAYPQVVDISFTDPDLDLRVSTDRIVDPRGRVLGFVKIITDRTRESEFKRSKSEFVSVIAHQLRAPLTSINWALSILRDNPNLQGEDKEIVAGSFDASVKVLKIINDLLDVSMIEGGRFGYRFEEVDPTEFISKILQEANLAAKSYGISLYFDKPEEFLPKIHVDPQKLGLALSNLIDNAIRYNIKNGRVTVKVEKLFDRPFIQFSISDTGVGIPENAINDIFKKFFRAENVTKTRPDGSGLGLYIVKNIVTRHGGEIWAESTLNRGTTFFVTIPTDPSLIPPKEVFYED